MSGAEAVYVVMGLVLLAWGLTGGADFGGGVWDLFARGERADEQRAAVARAIAPIWEANHVWLIFLLVLMFTAFPRAFAVVGVALHVPLVLALFGMVFRGTAFTFRAYGLEPDHWRRRWGRIFGVSSLATPVLLGMCLAAVSSGAIVVDDGRVTSDFTAGWLTPFAAAVGLFVLALFALLAAVYLTCDSEGAVQEDFRRRALIAEAVAGVFALAAFLTARGWAADIYANLARSTWAWPLQIATGLCAAGTCVALWRRAYRWARRLVVGQVALVIGGWAAAMNGHLILRDVNLQNAGAQSTTLSAVLWAAAAGTLLLAPALWLLFRLFKREPAPTLAADDAPRE